MRINQKEMPKAAAVATQAILETMAQPTPTEPDNMQELVKALESYDTTFHPECVKARNETAKFMASVQNGTGAWLSLLGGSGVGKTFLARLVRNWSKAEGISGGMFIRWVTVCDYMRKGDYGVLDAMADASVLIVDDIGADYETELSKSKIYVIAERRLRKPTLFTSNLNLEQIGNQIDVRVASRLVRENNRVVTFGDCPDWSVSNYKN